MKDLLVMSPPQGATPRKQSMLQRTQSIFYPADFQCPEKLLGGQE